MRQLSPAPSTLEPARPKHGKMLWDPLKLNILRQGSQPIFEGWIEVFAVDAAVGEILLDRQRACWLSERHVVDYFVI